MLLIIKVQTSLLLLCVLTQDQLCLLFGLANLGKVVVCSLHLLLTHAILLGFVVSVCGGAGLFLWGLFEMMGFGLF